LTFTMESNIHGTIRGMTKYRKVIEPAMREALNTAATKTKVRGADMIADTLGLPRSKKGNLKQGSKIRRWISFVPKNRATVKKLRAIIKARFVPLPVRYWGTIHKTSRGAKVGSKTYRGAFKARQSKNWQRREKGAGKRRKGPFTVFRRKSKKQYPIEEVKRPIATAANKVMVTLLRGYTQREYNKRLDQQIKHRVSKIAGFQKTRKMKKLHT